MIYKIIVMIKGLIFVCFKIEIDKLLLIKNKVIIKICLVLILSVC